ncbi:MAG: polyprenyl synthetase family protein [Lentisphaerae bacterium]|nr:polyprenyl synthetase family protein [Lentisphaerota bacterium]
MELLEHVSAACTLVFVRWHPAILLVTVQKKKSTARVSPCQTGRRTLREFVLAAAAASHKTGLTLDALDPYLAETRKAVDAALGDQLPPADARPVALHEAMRYAVFSGGKRLRPILCIASAEAVGGDPSAAMLPAVAVELLHTYTLVHDDLPCMDDDIERRGNPTCHIAFGEANAVLAGDALQALAFEILASLPGSGHFPPARFVQELALAAGSRGVVGGQVEDIRLEGHDVTADDIRFVHLHKTADLFRAAVRMGAMAGGASDEQLSLLTRFAVDLGLSFQIADDLLDAEESTTDDQGRVIHEETTILAVTDAERAGEEVRALSQRAAETVRALGTPRAEILEAIVVRLVNRTH